MGYGPVPWRVPENQYGTWKCPLGKGEAFTNHQFLGPMLLFREVCLEKIVECVEYPFCGSDVFARDHSILRYDTSWGHSLWHVRTAHVIHCFLTKLNNLWSEINNCMLVTFGMMSDLPTSDLNMIKLSHFAWVTCFFSIWETWTDFRWDFFGENSGGILGPTSPIFRGLNWDDPPSKWWV